MDVRCQNCGERMVLPPVKPSDTSIHVICKSCGVSMAVRVPTLQEAKHAHAMNEPRPSEETWKHVFNPFPRPVLYLAGIVLGLMLTSPFWAPLLVNRYTRERVFLGEETTNLVARSSTNADANPLMSASNKPITSLDQFHNLRLEANRDDVQHSFNLRPLNTRGMEPEVYETSKTGEFDHLTLYFYGGLLKELFVVGREQRIGVDGVQQDLVGQFGPPAELTEGENPIAAPSLTGLPTGDNSSRRINELPFHRSLIWTDEHYRVEAVIHYDSVEGAKSKAALSLHMIAASWLKNRAPLSNVISLPSH